MSATESAQIKSRRFPVGRVILVIPCVALILGAALLGARARVPDDRIVRGVHVSNLDLGGKTVDEARPVLEEWAKQKVQTSVSLSFSSGTRITRTWKPTAEALGLGIDLSATLEAANKLDSP